MRKITKRWLHSHGFPFDRLIVEGGNTYTRDPMLSTRNRFIISGRKNIRVFVEDSLPNAGKLADFCEIVFLIDHPYNQLGTIEIPNNVFRIRSWSDMYEKLRDVF